MDYIIIALWGLIAGGLLWGGSNRTSQPQQIITQNVEVETSELIERPTHQVSKPKVILSNDLTEAQEIKSQDNHYEDVAIVDSPFDDAPIIADKIPADIVPEPESSVETTTDAGSRNAISFNRTSKKSTKTKTSSSRKAIIFSKSKDDAPVTVEPEIQEQKAPEAISATEVKRDTVFVYTTPEAEPAQASVPTDKVEVAETQPKKTTETAQQPAATAAQPDSNKQTTVRLPKGLTIEQLMCDANGKPRIHKLKQGETLSQIAHQYYEDACFWPYIFEVNKSKLKSPDRLQADMRLYLPDPNYYGINGNNPASVSRAKEFGRRYTK